MQLLKQTNASIRPAQSSSSISSSRRVHLRGPGPQHSVCSKPTSVSIHDKDNHGHCLAVCRAISSDPEANQEFGLEMSPASDQELQCDKEWISSMIASWLDEEWAPLEVHQQLGQAAGAAYVTCRQRGDDDMSSLVLGLSNELLAFNYRETFVNAFEVANKVVEMLMMRSGIDVCCTSDDDVQRMERVSSTDSSS